MRVRRHVSNPFVLIAAGGFAGAVLRAVISGFTPGVTGTLLVNAAGSFILGFLMYSMEFGGTFGRDARLMIGIGFCGSLTTFSTFILQSLSLTLPGFAVNVLGNVVLCLASVFAGRAVSILLFRRGVNWS